MSSSDSYPTKPYHVLAIPYPGRGHINPLLNLCKSLTLQNPETHLQFTFIITEEWLTLLESEPKPSSLEYATIPNVIPSEHVRGSDITAFLDAVFTKMEGPVEEVLDRIEKRKGKMRLIVADSYLCWAVSIGNRRRIPVASFWPMSASVFCMFYHFQTFISNRCYPIDLSAADTSGDERIDFIPGLSSIRLADLPHVFFQGSESMMGFVRRALSTLNKAQYLLFRSIYELEPTPIDTLKSKLSVPIYPIGPAVPYLNLKQNPFPISGTKPIYLQWLDFQPQNSVLYVSLGSFCPVSSQQMDEIGAGLRDSGVLYLWVARGEASRWGNDNGDKGFVVSWCDQLRVLSHSSVGGFLTHCGWNSTLESVLMGVPVLTFPIIMDQMPNSKLMVEDWGVGWRLKTRKGADCLVTREEISSVVKRFMDLGSKEREKLEINARRLQGKARSGMAEGGSSETNLEAFCKSIREL